MITPKISPPTNEFLDNGSLCQSYRSSLLELEDSFIPLNQEEIEELKKDLQSYKEKLSDLEKYFNSSITQHQIDKLPPGWMDKRASLNAMKERIERLERVLNSNDSINLRDISMSMNPSFKMFSALGVALKMVSHPPTDPFTMNDSRALQAEVFSETLYVDELFKFCEDYGVDPAYIKSLVDDPTKSFDEIVLDIKEYLASTPREAKPEYARADLLTSYYKNAAVDLKDVGREEANNTAFLIAVDKLKNEAIFDQCTIYEGDPREIDLEFKVKGESVKAQLDYLTLPGKFIVKYGSVELPPLTIEELKRYMTDLQLPKDVSGFNQVLAKLHEIGLSIKSINTLSAMKEAKNLKPGESFVAQERGSRPPILTLYHKNEQGIVESYKLGYKGLPSVEFILKTVDGNMSITPEKLKSLLK